MDPKLSFKDHINNLCEKASKKLNVLATVASYMYLKKRKPVMKAFVTSQIGHCHLL